MIMLEFVFYWFILALVAGVFIGKMCSLGGDDNE
jgi:hypothetical protein